MSPSPPPEQRPVETTDGRYVVRECEGYAINLPIRDPSNNARTSIECVALDSLYNYRRVASFTSSAEPSILGRAAMFGRARQAAADRCAELNRADELARSAAA